MKSDNTESYLGWALIGASNIALSYMLEAISSHEKCKVKALVTSSEERGREFKRILPQLKIYQGLEEVKSDPEIEVVYVSGLNESHFEVTRQMIMSGKHVLCEKPLSLTVDNAYDLVRLGEEEKVVLGTNYHLRCAGSIRRIKETLNSGAIGRVQGVRVGHSINLPSRLKTWRLESVSGGTFWDIGVHNVDLLRFLFDAEVESVLSCSVKNKVTEVFSMNILQLANGVMCSTNEGFLTPFAGNYIEIMGDKGYIKGSGVLTQEPVGIVELVTDAGREVLRFDSESLYRTSVKEFVRACMKTDASPAATGRDGLMGVKVACAMKKSSIEGKKVQVL